MSAPVWSEEQLLAAFDPKCHWYLRRWLARGDGAAVYENAEVGHPNGGHLKAVSYGSAEAMIKADGPPEQMPDIGQTLNWRYRLKAVCRPSHN